MKGGGNDRVRDTLEEKKREIIRGRGEEGEKGKYNYAVFAVC